MSPGTPFRYPALALLAGLLFAFAGPVPGRSATGQRDAPASPPSGRRPGATALAAPSGRELLFERDVRPILKAHCWQCHGEEDTIQGGLDTRLARLLVKGGRSGAAVVPGNPNDSRLYRRVAAGEMPPGPKKLSARELRTLAEWIGAGARTARPEPAAPSAADSFTDEERAHWSFQPITTPAVPRVKRQDRVRAPIDAFLLARLEAKGQGFGPEADRETLIRRLYFDLTGLPPSPEAVNRFTADVSPDAYEKLVDDLLASPEYGERWARHWLDVAGYADSDGYSEQDSLRPWAYQYRDYVIRAFNADRPWNEFLVEQLAGDELVPAPNRDLTPEQADRLIATGFLRMGPDGTGASDADAPTARNQVIAETIKITSTAILGLSVGCAQCHNHRYDPITQVDYYRVRALFAPAYDWKKWRTPAQRLVSLWSDAERDRAAAADRELQALSKQRQAELDAIVQSTFEREVAKLPNDAQQIARTVRSTPPAQRTPAQKQFLAQHPFVGVDGASVARFRPDKLAEFTKRWDDLIAAAGKARPADRFAMCLTEAPGPLPPTHLFARGDFQQPRQEVAPGELSVLNRAGAEIPSDDPSLPTSGRRLAYARHLTNGRHPLVARVLVNRFWLHHFGQGLVSTPGDFGTQGERPSHPELLDWLASDFMAGGWKLKRLHRLLVCSTAYRQTSRRRSALDALDPENRLLGRMPVRRLEAETIRDSLLAASGRLTRKLYGPPVPVSPDEGGQVIIAVDTRDGSGRPTGKFVPLGDEEFRRSIYIQMRRTMPLGVLEPFDLPPLSPNCERRASSTAPSQALLMLNNPFVLQQASLFADRVRRQAGADLATQCRLAWRLALGHTPSLREVEDGVAFLRDEQAANTPNAEAKPAEVALPALTRFCHALVASNAFLYVE